jgi:hypothetical protein
MLGKMMTNMMNIIISGSFHRKNHAKPWVGMVVPDFETTQIWFLVVHTPGWKN